LVKGTVQAEGYCKFFERKTSMSKGAKAAAADSAAFNFFLPLSKVERNKDGSCTVAGYASTPALDLDGEVVSLDAIKAALPGYWEWRNIRQMHQPSAVGVAKEANVDAKGLFLTSRITDRDAAQKCLDQVYKGYSIGGRKLAKTGNTITEIELIEVSLVDRPANPECRIEVAKSFKAKENEAAYLVKAAKAKTDPTTKILGKVASMAEGITEFLTKNGNPPAAHDGFSLPAKPVEKAASCAAHGMADCPDCKCAAHGLMDCTKCAKKAAKKTAKLLKREVKEKERESLASQGNALPGGGFPIKNKEDLSNARQAVGRAKDPGAARALIRRRAAELGVELPDKWSKKLGKSLVAEAEWAEITEKMEAEFGLTKSAKDPSFLNLEPADVSSLSLTDEGSLGAMTKRGEDGTSFLDLKKDLRKGGETSVPLTEDNWFSSLKNGDTTMAKEASLDQMIVDILKAGRQPSRAQRVAFARDNMKKARGARKEAAGAIKATHGMMKAAYLAKEALVKAGKKPPEPDADGDFDMGKAMGHMQKAFGALDSMKTFMKAAGEQMKKVGQAAQSPTSGTAGYKVPTGVESVSQGTMTEGTPDIDPGDGQPWGAGKAAKGSKSIITQREADLLERAARAEGAAEALGRLPAGGRKPVAFDVSRLGINSRDPVEMDKAATLMSGVNPADLASNDEGVHNQATAKMLGNMILGGKHGKPVFDPDFGGAVGGGRTH
jgi:hypothetical protein